MIQMANSDPATLASTFQCLFFGVPSQGMHISTFLPIVHNQHNALTLLPYLSENSLWLKEQNRKFPKAFHFKDSTIVCFYETQESPTAIQVGFGLTIIHVPSLFNFNMLTNLIPR
jgi:hypothetical protein